MKKYYEFGKYVSLKYCGFRKYASLFQDGKGKIRENDIILVFNNNYLERYYANSNGTLTWENVHTKNRLVKRKIKNLENILPSEVLSRKRWGVQKQESCV